jgi:glucan 1,3-beta-glucosidase
MKEASFLRGVNLGGWLLLEKWLTPTLFKGTGVEDEYAFMKTPGAKEKIDRHRREFITEEDFKWLAKNRINAVRIPVGYWILENDEPYVEGAKYLDWAVETAGRHNIWVLIDLHGAKGSQSGKDHSGKKGKSEWFENEEFRTQTIATLEKLADRYKNAENLWGIELLNEPKFGLFHFKLRRFYKKAYERVSKVVGPDVRIVFHDGFTPRLMSGAIKGKTTVMDIHWYQFTVLFPWLYSLKMYFKKVTRRKVLISRLQKQQPIIIGEWSVVLSGEILKGLTKIEENEAFKTHAKLQQDAYAGTAGWFYWSYKAEGRGIWNFRSLVEDKVITLD